MVRRFSPPSLLLLLIDCPSTLMLDSDSISCSPDITVCGVRLCGAVPQSAPLRASALHVAGGLLLSLAATALALA